MKISFAQYFGRCVKASLAAGLVLGGALATNAAAQVTTLRLSNPIGKQTAHQFGAEYFAKRVAELTNGQVKVEVFPDGLLGSEAKVLEGLQTGTIDMTMSTLWTNVVVSGKAFDLPFLFRDFDHWKKVTVGKPGQMAADGAKGTGVRVLGYWLAGTRNVYGGKPIRNMQDLAGLKIRTLQAPAYLELFRAAKAIPTPIAWPETYMALQQGTVNAAETTFESMYDAKQYEVAKFGSYTRHAVGTAAFLFSDVKWNSLPEGVRAAITTAQKEASEVHSKKFLENEAAVIGQLQSKGFTFNDFDSAQLREIALKDVYPRLVTDEAQKGILAEIRKL